MLIYDILVLMLSKVLLVIRLVRLIVLLVVYIIVSQTDVNIG